MKHTVPPDARTSSCIDVGRDGEAISYARLSFSCTWPEEDIRLQPQNTRQAGPEDEKMIAECAHIRRLDWDRLLGKIEGKPVPGQVCELIDQRTIQFNSRSRYSQCDIWRNRVKAACENGYTIHYLEKRPD